MPSLGMPELIFLFVLALLIFGPRKLPELGRSLGKSLGEFRRASNELRSTLEEEVRLEEQKEHKAKMEAEQSSAVEAGNPAAAENEIRPPDPDQTSPDQTSPDQPTVSRSTTGTSA